MSLIRVFIALFVIDLFLIAPSFAQNGEGDKKQEKESSQVEVETDRFSGKTTVRLKPQVLLDTPEHKLIMALDGQGAAFGIRFESISRNYIIFGDRELWFIGRRRAPESGFQQSVLTDGLRGSHIAGVSCLSGAAAEFPGPFRRRVRSPRQYSYE